jgi:cytochrome c oxidase assembly factor CtaG
MRYGRSISGLTAVVAASAAWLMVPGRVQAHGSVPVEPPDPSTLLLGWTFEPIPTLSIIVAIAWWSWAVRRVNRAHPGNPVPRRRTWYFLAAMLALALALISGIDRYDTTLFSVHMVQHVLLILVSAPLLALAAPVTLVLRVSSPQTRRRWILPVLRSRLVRFLSHPIVAWLAMAIVLWGSHFTPLFDAALEDPLVHDLEHVLFLTVAMLFWWPVVALDPAPHRMGHPARMGYVFLQMMLNTFLAVIILGAGSVLYAHYETLAVPWVSDALQDQRQAAAIMWVAGDAIFIGALLALVYGWMRAEERSLARNDREAATDLAAIRARERLLADRLAEERSEGR